MRREAGALRDALTFLTLLPLGSAKHTDPAAIARSLHLFPLAGAVIGALALVAGLLTESLLSPGLAPLAAVTCMTIVTAGFHLDGLADSADALFSWRSRERKLEIMMDSRIGTMGALALFLCLLWKVSLLGTLGPAWCFGIILAPVSGRWADLYGIRWFPAARQDGAGNAVHQHFDPRSFTVATAIWGAIALLVAGWAAVVIVPTVWAVIHWAAHRMSRALGGLTGDSYGCLSELGEVVALAALVAVR